MSSVDSRIVSMKFDNAQFEQGASTTMSTLDKLKASLNFTGVSKGFDTLATSTAGVEANTSKLSAGFVAMSTVAITAISNVTNKIVDAGIAMGKSLTIAPIAAGFAEYELKLGSIQTILANTARYGTSLDEVSASLGELNEYADKTIYNFGDMTKNIGLFTNAGIRVEDATSMIKGFSNAAAASGTSAEGAAGAAYQLSQALSTGKITLMDWRSLTNVGMGNKNMQEGIIGIAEAMGTFEGKGVDAAEAQKNFNGTLEKGWLTADVMSSYLQIMAGDMDEAKMKSMGLSEEQIKTFQQQQKTAEEAATKVRTFTQLIGTMREAVGSGWSQTFETIFGDFDEATELFTGINDVIGGFIKSTSDARNKVLADWKDLGGRTVLIEGIKNAFTALMDVLKPIRDAFRQIFPAKTGQDLYDLTVKFRDFTEKLKVSDETAANLKRTFAGVFAVFSIIAQVVKGVIGVFAGLIGAVAGGSGGFLNFTGGIGDFLVRIDEALKKGDALKNFFENLTDVLKAPLEGIKAIARFLGSIFSGIDMGGAEGITDFLGTALEYIDRFVDAVREAFGVVGTALRDAFSGASFGDVLNGLQVGLFGGILLLLRNFIKKFSIFGESGVTGMFGSITGAFEQLTGTLKSMQQNVKANVILKIAIAVGILALALISLALIDADDLAKATTAITVLFVELLAAMKIMEKITSSKGFYKMPFVASAMILLSVAVLVLSAAVKNLAGLSWEELARGLGGVAALMLILSAAAKPLSANAKGMIRAGAGILILSIALNILALAVKSFAEMSWTDLGKGLAGVAGSLVVIAGAMRLMPKNIALTAVGIGILAVSLKLLATVVKDFSGMNWSDMGRGLAGLAGTLVAIGIAMRLMPKNMPLTAAGLVLVAGALAVIGKVIKTFSKMSWEEIGKGLATLAGALVILSAGLYAMSGTLAGSAALLVAAAALAVITPVLIALGSVSWQTLVQGLLALAGIFVVLGVAGLLLTPLVPTFLALAAAMLALGAGMVLAGAGVLMFVTALAILVALGGAAALVIAEILTAVIESIPEMLQAFGEGIVAFADAISKGGPKFVAAITTVIGSMLDALIKLAPKFRETFETVIQEGLTAIRNLTPDIVETGYQVLLDLMKGLRDHIQEITTVGIEIITEFMQAIEDQDDELADQALQTITSFVEAVATAIDNNKDELNAAGGHLAASIVSGLATGLLSTSALGMVGRAVGGLVGFIRGRAEADLESGSPSQVFVRMGHDIGDGLAIGITDSKVPVGKSMEDLSGTAVEGMKSTMTQISDAIASDIDVNPVIAPVLDLSNLQRDAAKVSSIFDTKPVAAVSFSKATGISTTQREAQVAEVATEKAAPIIQFEQNNYSPKELSSIEIYRQTRNQLSLAKEALTV